MATSYRTRVWDLPTRLFHWALVLCFLGSFVSGKLGGNLHGFGSRSRKAEAARISQKPRVKQSGNIFVYKVFVKFFK